MIRWKSPLGRPVDLRDLALLLLTVALLLSIFKVNSLFGALNATNDCRAKAAATESAALDDIVIDLAEHHSTAASIAGLVAARDRRLQIANKGCP